MSSFACPTCKGDTQVRDSRPSAQGLGIRRRRWCETCGHRFTSYEIAADGSTEFVEMIDGLAARTAVMTHNLSDLVEDIARIQRIVSTLRELEEAKRAPRQEIAQ